MPNTGTPKYVRQILTFLKGAIDSSTIIVEDFNTLLASMGRSSGHKINKETLVFSDTRPDGLSRYI